MRQETGDHHSIGDVRVGNVGCDNEAVPVDAQVQLLPAGAGTGAVFPRRPLTLAADLQAGRVAAQVDAVRSAGIPSLVEGPPRAVESVERMRVRFRLLWNQF